MGRKEIVAAQKLVKEIKDLNDQFENLISEIAQEGDFASFDKLLEEYPRLQEMTIEDLQMIVCLMLRAQTA